MSPRIARTIATTIIAIIAKPNKAVTAPVSGDGPIKRRNALLRPAMSQPNKMNIRLSTHFELVVVRREMDQHFKHPARRATATSNWPVICPAFSALISPSKKGWKSILSIEQHAGATPTDSQNDAEGVA